MRHIKSSILILALLSILFASGCAYKNHIKRGDALYTQGNYEQALYQYEAALQKRPNNKDAQYKVEATRQAFIEQLSADTIAYLNEQNYVAALNAAFTLENRFPELPAVRQLVRDVSARIQSDAKSSSDRAEWAKALDTYLIAYDAFPEDRQAIEPELQYIKTTWYNELDKAAKEAESKGHTGDALLLHAQASQLQPNPQSVAKRDELQARLLNESLFQIKLSGRGDRFNRVASSLLNLQGLSQNLVFFKEAKQQPDATLAINVGRPSFSTQRSNSQRYKDYISGTRLVENPQYINRQNDLEREQRDLFRYEDDLSRAERDVDRYMDQVAREGDTPGVSTGAEQSLSRAQSDLERARDNVDRARRRVRDAERQLNDTPPNIEEDVYSTLEYSVTTHTRLAKMSLDLRMTDPQGEELVQSFRPALSASDETHRAYPIADIPEDPLDLPSDASLETQLFSSAINSSFSTANTTFQKHRQAVLADAFAQQDQGLRVHHYVIYILMDPSSVDQRVLDEIADLRGIPDAAGLLLMTNTAQ